MDGPRFATAGAVVVAVAALAAPIAVVVAGAPTAFAGSIVASGLVTAVFAGENVRSVRTTGAPSFAAAGVATVLGVWLAVAPLVYDAGFVPVATTQFCGLLVAAFAAHGALTVVEGALGRPRGATTGGSDHAPGGE